MAKIFLTGGAGFIGFHVAKLLLERGDEVVIADNLNEYYDPALKEERIKQLGTPKNLEFCKADVSDAEEVENIFKKHKFDKICHLAAQAGTRYSLENPFAYEKTNVLGTLVLLEMAKKYKIKDFVFASSSSVYGDNKKVPFSESDKTEAPVSVYAATKKAGELLCHTFHKNFGLNCTCLRFFTVYGPWGRPDMAYFKFAKDIINGKPIDVYNKGDLKRDFTFIADIVKGVVSAIDTPFPFEIINLGNNKPVELGYFIECIEEALGMKAEKNLLPMQPGDVYETFADIQKAKKLLGFEPKTNIKEGIKLFVDWYKEHYRL